MIKKLILSLSLISIIAPVHGMWNNVRQTFGKLSGTAVGCMERAHQITKLAMPKSMSRIVIPAASKRTVSLERAQELKTIVDGFYKGYRESRSGNIDSTNREKIKKEMSEYCAKLSDVQMHEVIDALHSHYDEGFMYNFLNEVHSQEVIPWSPTIKHMLAHHKEYEMRQDPPKVQEIVNQVIDYASEEEKKGNIVFFHGQGWKWQFFEFLNKELSKKGDNPIPDEHTSLRFKNSSPLDLIGQKALAIKGIRQGDGFDWDRWNGLFVNAGLYSCTRGSNSVDYFRDNYDQSIKQERNVQEEKELFSSFGEEKLFEKIKDSLLFKQLSILHNNLSKHGNLITISMPEKLVKEIVYPTASGGPRITLENLESKKSNLLPKRFACSVDVVKHIDKTQFETKFVLVLGENIVNAEEAAKAGVTVRSWNSTDKENLAFFKKVVQHLIHNSDDIEERKQLENGIVLAMRSTVDFFQDLPLFKKLIDSGSLDINTLQNSDKTVLGCAVWESVNSEENNSKAVKQLLEWGADANTAMSIAVESDNIGMVRLLLEYGANATRLVWSAVDKNNIEMVRLLLEHGSNVNEEMKSLLKHHSFRGIHAAIESDNIEMVKLLLKHGANVTSGMQLAVSKNNIEMVRLLLEHGENVTEEVSYLLNIHHFNGIYAAVRNNNFEIIKLLLEHGADASRGIYAAVIDNNFEMIKLLLEHGADASEGIDTAAGKNNIEMVKFLLEHGADASRGINTAVSKNNIEIVKFLLEHGADANKGIYSAVSKNNIEIVKFLLEHGAYGKAISAAIKVNNIEMVKLLINHGVGARDVMSTAIDENNFNMVKRLLSELGWYAGTGMKTAVYQGKIKMTMLLLKHGADVNRVIGIIDTPLSIAVKNNDFEMVKFLLENGADANKGRLITSMNSVEMIALLKKYGAKE